MYCTIEMKMNNIEGKLFLTFFHVLKFLISGGKNNVDSTRS